MPTTKLPASAADTQVVQVAGPNGSVSVYQYDLETHAFYAQEGQLLPTGKHGKTHVADDPIPAATCAAPGLMSADDKCKLDAILQTRIGILGFMGAGFPDDGGWLQGDIIFAPGTDFVSIEKIGNVVRFTVDSPIPLSPDCEGCRQLFWVRDETAPKAIRPPTCNGIMPDVNVYGEMRVYALPESTIVDAANPANTLLKRNQYPAFLFTRYQNSLSTNLGEVDVILQRSPTNLLQAVVGWTMTPGPAGVPQCRWFMGTDSTGGLCYFDLANNAQPGLLGSLLYKGHLLTKQMAIIVGYTSTVLSNNQYVVQMFDVVRRLPVGDQLVATNLWRLNTPSDPASIAPDSQFGPLPVGTLIDLWYFQIQQIAGTPLLRYFFNKQPHFNPYNLWTEIGAVQFGDVGTGRKELETGEIGTDPFTANLPVNLRYDFENTIWGLSGFDEAIIPFDAVQQSGTLLAQVNTENQALIDTTLPGLRVSSSNTAADLPVWRTRPVILWNRQATSGNVLVRADVGGPHQDTYPPYDILLNAPVDRFANVYMTVTQLGNVSGLNYVMVKGITPKDIPSSGVVRVISPSSRRNLVWRYFNKFVFPSSDPTAVVLAGSSAGNDAFTGKVGDILEYIQRDFTSPCVRVEMGVASNGQLSFQVKVGILSMATKYEGHSAAVPDDYVRGLLAGYAVSGQYTQATVWDGTGVPPATNAAGFGMVNGGVAVSDQAEHWNTIEVLWRDGQVWVWWNHLLIPPDAGSSANLPTPVTVNTAYFPMDTALRHGKVAMRMWPGATLRRCSVRSQPRVFSELTYGQLEPSL
jgi:hypothetical protein